MGARYTRAACYGAEVSLVAPSRSVNAMYPTVTREHVVPLPAWLWVASAGHDEAFLWRSGCALGVRLRRRARQKIERVPARDFRAALVGGAIFPREGRSFVPICKKSSAFANAAC